MNSRALVLGLAIGFSLAMVPSCGPTSKCSSATCGTCCDSKGQCVQKGTNGNNTTCGNAGALCADCTKTGQACNAGTFTCGSGGSGGGSGGGAAGGTGGGTGGGTCAGCMMPVVGCLIIANQTTSNCGSNGAACLACQPGQNCTNGACVSGPAQDAGTGALGESCTQDSDCRNTGLAGLPGYCKKTSIPGGNVYQDGFCTHRCISSASCGTGGTCAYFLGSLGERENLCLPHCASHADCRDGYRCINWGSTSSCWIWPDGGFPPDFDAGPPATYEAGQACAADLQCVPPDTGWCVEATKADGGPTGFPGGTCTADCSLSMADSFCGDGGVCFGYQDRPDVHGPTVVWLCERGCDTAADAGTGCRTGYVCDPFSGTKGICTPDCRNAPTGFCGTQTCSADAGTCS